MMPGKHYKWHTKWTLAQDGQTAAHESGFTVRYDHDSPVCSLAPDKMQAWIAAQEAQGVRGNGAIERRIHRLLKEANDLLTWQKKKPTTR